MDRSAGDYFCRIVLQAALNNVIYQGSVSLAKEQAYVCACELIERYQALQNREVIMRLIHDFF